MGYKIFDYSFVTLGYRNYYSAGATSSIFLQGGWDSQDNANFPTQGSRLTATFLWNTDIYYGHYYGFRPVPQILFSYLKHWEFAPQHILTFRVGNPFTGTDPAFAQVEDQALAVRYTYQFKRHATSSFIRNAGVYIEPGVTYFDSPGVKMGTLLETPYGMMNFAFLAGGR